jgi:hypothetical protein
MPSYRPYTHAEAGRAQRSVRRAPWSLCVTFVGTWPSHVVRARWPRCAAQAPPLARRPPHVAAPFRRTPAMSRPTPQLGCLGAQGSTPHRLAPSYKSRRLLSSSEHRAAVARHWHPLGELIALPTSMDV